MTFGSIGVIINTEIRKENKKMGFVIIAVVLFAGILVVLLLTTLADFFDCEIFEVIGQIIFIALITFMIVILVGLCIVFVYTALEYI